MQRICACAAAVLLMITAPSAAATLQIDNTPALVETARRVAPGARIELAPGTWQGNCKLTGLRGTPTAPVEIVAQDPANPPIFDGGEVAFQLIDCAYVLIDGIVAQHATVNNLQVGDGSHHIVLKDVVSRDIRGQSNCDGIKMPGLTDFLLYNCRVENWGGEGSAIDMVGCALGLLYGCRFRYPDVKGQTANALQPKGGTHSMGFYKCVFEDASHRAVQFGGATGKPYFFQGNYDTGYEGLDMAAMGNVIRGGGSAAAFVSCTHCTFAYNTIVEPRQFVLRILKEGGTKPTANNTFAHNLIVYGQLAQVLNHGGPDSVDLSSFMFADNYWYNTVDPAHSIPNLPVRQKGPAGGKDPKLDKDLVPTEPAARQYGAAAPGLDAAWREHTGRFAWAWQQAQALERRARAPQASQPARPVRPAATAPTTAIEGLDAEIRLENRTGSDKTDWPVFLTVYKVFGANLDLKAIHPDGFHVYDEAGREIPHMVRPIPPDFSIGNDQVVFVVPKMRAGEVRTFRVTNTKHKGLSRGIDLLTNRNNLLPNDRFNHATEEPPARVERGDFRDRPGPPGVQITLPVNSGAALVIPGYIRFRKDGHYHCSFWAKTDNVAYTGWGFWDQGGHVAFFPQALRGHGSIQLRGTRDWHCYTFDAGGRDDWGLPTMGSVAQTATVRDKGKDVPADIWQQDGMAVFTIKARQADQPFLSGDKTGRIWLDEVLLFEQPVITVNRTEGLGRVARNGAIVFARPVNMPRTGVFAHEAVERLETFAMAGERRQVRFGVHAVRPFRDVRIEVSALRSGSAELPARHLEVESLDEYVDSFDNLKELAAGKSAEWLLGIDVPRDTPAGTFTGKVRIIHGASVLREIPLTLEVLPFAVPDMKPYLVGGIYNTGMGLTRDGALYECYAKTGFNFLLLFDYLFRWQDGKLDIAGAQRQVDEITTIARVRDAIGLYREPNMSEDQPRLWYQVAAGQPEYQGTYRIGTQPQFKEEYQALARQADAYARRHDWPELVYMVSDEPGDKRDVDPSMGWLQEALPRATTLADVQFKDMLATWQWYSLPVFDDPIDWTGPLVYDYVRRQGHAPYGFCGTGWALDVARYQPGLMLAASGATYWHFWHLKGPFEPRNASGGRSARVVRSHAVAAMAEGVNDLRYYILLKRAIEAARQNARRDRSSVAAGRLVAHAIVAEKHLEILFRFATADHDRHLMPYNGVPETWGYDCFYDDWRAQMKDALLQLRSAVPPPKAR